MCHLVSILLLTFGKSCFLQSAVNKPVFRIHYSRFTVFLSFFFDQLLAPGNSTADGLGVGQRTGKRSDVGIVFQELDC